LIFVVFFLFAGYVPSGLASPRSGAIILLDRNIVREEEERWWSLRDEVRKKRRKRRLECINQSDLERIGKSVRFAMPSIMSATKSAIVAEEQQRVANPRIGLTIMLDRRNMPQWAQQQAVVQQAADNPRGDGAPPFPTVAAASSEVGGGTVTATGMIASVLTSTQAAVPLSDVRQISFCGGGAGVSAAAIIQSQGPPTPLPNTHTLLCLPASATSLTIRLDRRQVDQQAAVNQQEQQRQQVVQQQQVAQQQQHVDDPRGGLTILLDR
jgi:hypothetical protein